MKKVFRPVVVASLIAAVINQAIYFVAVGFFSVEFLLNSAPPSEIPLFAPALFSVFQGVLGGVVVAWIATRTTNPRNTWLAISLAALALSFTAGFIATALQSALWLNAMHVVTGALIIPMVALALNNGQDAATPR
ncbi:DUF6069 family protein [Pontimonas sp.]|nr:DUF6069 family protein [Pontimonas sp.]